MITSLYVKNIALIEELRLELASGLNILSGETGAGKSIIIDSLNFVLGDRADRSLIRHGTSSACVQVVFTDDDKPEIAALMEEFGIERDENVIVRRVMQDNGRGEARVNNVPVTLQQLRRLVVLLVDVHSQHEHQNLLNEANHLGILDKYIVGFEAVHKEYLAHYDKYRKALTDIAAFGDESARARRADTLEYQLAEIERISPEEGEEEELGAKRDKFRNAEKILTALNTASALIDSDDGTGALSSIQNAGRELNAIDRYDPAYSSIAERLDGVKIELRDIADEIQSELASAEYDPREARVTEERLEELKKLKRKYGDFADMARFVEDATKELEEIKNAGEKLVALNALAEQEGTATVKYAKKLHEARSKAATEFSASIERNLRELGMKSARFEAVTAFPADDESVLAACGAHGADSVRFMISPNLGEPLKPLAKIASGGEMSRFMLGLKNITADLEDIDTLVFDEIDTGISGAIAKVVACKLYDIARTRQVIAITHLPQLASMADNHYLIAKSEEGGKTLTRVTRLDAESELRELMRLQGSNENSAVGRENAVELKNWADAYKNG